MSDESVDVVRAAFEAWRGGADSLLDFLSDDIDWEVRPDLPDAGRYRGHDGFRRLSARFDDVMSDMWFRPMELIAVGGGQGRRPPEMGRTGKGQRPALRGARRDMGVHSRRRQDHAGEGVRYA
jgi:ketosteroid isomerase-like protein